MKFGQVLAIDVVERLDNFLKEISKYTDKAPMLASRFEDLDFKDLMEVDCLMVSIYEPLCQEKLSKLKNLKNIFILGTSTSQIDNYYCIKIGIKIFNVENYCGLETAEWIFGKMVSFFRAFPPFSKEIPQSINKKILGLIGVGEVGGHVLKLASSFGMRVYYTALTEHAEFLKFGAFSASKEFIIKNADVLSLHVPRNTLCLDEKDLLLAKVGLLIINSSMGEVISKKDLAKFLNARSDVTILMDKVAGKNYRYVHEGILISEQAAFATKESLQRLKDFFWNNVKLFISDSLP